MENLKTIAKNMVSPGKGILAADESTPTCTKRFENLGIVSSEENRNKYRSNLFTTKLIEEYISGVILFDETFYQNIYNTNTSIPDYLKQKNILTGIKVDCGAKNLANHKFEKITEGLDGLQKRVQEYRKLGASFAKWRAVITINNNIPSNACLKANAHALARYASICQENGLVPIVEPEVLMDGNHSIEKCYEITENTLKYVFEELELFRIDLEAIVLKPNMVLPGNKSNQEIDDNTIAKMTFEVLYNHVPKSVPGIAFLSGGQTSDEATQRLNILNKLYGKNSPWKLTFSYGRALQKDALKKWSKNEIKESQNALLHRARMNHLASTGNM